MSTKSPLTLAQAEAYVRDVLAEMDEREEGDWLRWAVAGRLVGPLEFDGRSAARSGLHGAVGTIDAKRGGEAFAWSVTSVGVEYAPDAKGPTDLDGEAPHFREADAAMCAALRALGWHVLGGR